MKHESLTSQYVTICGFKKFSKRWFSSEGKITLVQEFVYCIDDRVSASYPKDYILLLFLGIERIFNSVFCECE